VRSAIIFSVSFLNHPNAQLSPQPPLFSPFFYFCHFTIYAIPWLAMEWQRSCQSLVFVPKKFIKPFVDCPPPVASRRNMNYQHEYLAIKI
jgi:hypothetical protein